MNRYAGLLRAVVITLVCVFALFGTVSPAAAVDSTIGIELWLEVDGSGIGRMNVYIPVGATENIDDLYDSLAAESSLYGVEKVDLGGGRYQINFTWSSFYDAFNPNTWMDNGDKVEGEFGALVDSFAEVILHLPGAVIEQQGGTKVDNFTLSFKGGSTATFTISKGSVVPSPTPTPSSSPTAGVETYDVELWVNADGSGKATITAYLPPGGNTAEDMVSSLQSEPTFSGVTQKSLGGDRYEVTFQWSDFAAAFDPGAWTVSGSEVQLDFGYLTETFTETTIHLPGSISSFPAGVQLDDYTVVFGPGETTELTISLGATPTPSPTSPTPKPTPTSSTTPKPTPTSSTTPKPTPTPTPTPKPTTPVPTNTPPPPPTTQPSPSPSGPNPTSIPIPTTTPVPGSTPSSGLPIWAIAAIAGGAVLVILVLFLLLRGKRRPPTPPSGTPYGASATPPYGAPPVSTPPKPTTGARFCPSCGSPVLAGAPFCATCGAAQGGAAAARPVPPPPPPATVIIAAPLPPVDEPTPPPVVEPVSPPVIVEEASQEAKGSSPTLCAGCGNPLPAGARFCMSCGKAVE